CFALDVELDVVIRERALLRLEIDDPRGHRLAGDGAQLRFSGYLVPPGMGAIFMPLGAQPQQAAPDQQQRNLRDAHDENAAKGTRPARHTRHVFANISRWREVLRAPLLLRVLAGEHHGPWPGRFMWPPAVRISCAL